jgi:ferrous iron transport protein B
MTHGCEDSPGKKVPDGDITIVLAGRPNAGKSSLFNVLTGGDARVGNFPGITVDILEATVTHNGRTLRIVDLPGLYSLHASEHESEEAIARHFIDALIANKTTAVLVQVTDATSLGLGLRLTRELMTCELPLALAATQRDVLENQGRTLDEAVLRNALEIAVVSVSVHDKDCKQRVLDVALEALSRSSVRTQQFDPDAVAQRAVTEHQTVSDAAMDARKRTARIDQWLLHPTWGVVLFFALMTVLFSAVFLVADPASALVDRMVRVVTGVIEHAMHEGPLRSFLVDGLLGGAGTVLTFLPQIVVLTVAMELLDASGYLARGVFLIDRILRVFGMGGKSFVPLLTGHACAVPALAATRIIRDPRERLTTILVIPLMTCAARIPTYALLLSTFFSTHGPLFRAAAFVVLYALGVLLGMLASLALRKTATRGRSLPLVLEMPAYRRPDGVVMARIGARAALRFVRDVGTTILAASAVLWVVLNVPAPGAWDRATSTVGEPATVARLHHSVGANVGRMIEPVTQLAGFDWRINVGLMGSFGARELMVGTLGVISGLENVEDDSTALATRLRSLRNPDGTPVYTPATGLSIAAFFLLACQCMSTVAAVKRETGSWRWALFTLGWTYVAGFALAITVFQLARIFV